MYFEYAYSENCCHPVYRCLCLVLLVSVFFHVGVFIDVLYYLCCSSVCYILPIEVLWFVQTASCNAALASVQRGVPTTGTDRRVGWLRPGGYNLTPSECLGLGVILLTALRPMYNNIVLEVCLGRATEFTAYSVQPGKLATMYRSSWFGYWWWCFPSFLT